MFKASHFPPISTLSQGGDGQQQFDRWLKFRSFQQQPVVYVAAVNTPEQYRYMAQYKCDGIADEVEINAATNEAYQSGEVVVLLGGTFYIEDLILQRAVILDARGARIQHSGDYTGALWLNNNAESELIGGVWGRADTRVLTEPVLWVGNDRTHLHRVHAGSFGSIDVVPSIYVPSGIYDTNITECQAALVHIDGWANHINGCVIHDLLITGAETYMGNNNIRRTFYDFGHGTQYEPGYQMAYNRIVSNHALTGSEAAITGLRTRVIKASGTYPQTIRVRAQLLTSNTSANGRNKFNLKTGGGTYLDETQVTIDTVGDRVKIILEWQGKIETDTYFEVVGFEVSGAGQVDANAAYPAWIEILAIGNAVSGMYTGDGDFHLQYTKANTLSVTKTFPTASIAT